MVIAQRKEIKRDREKKERNGGKRVLNAKVGIHSRGWKRGLEEVN